MSSSRGHLLYSLIRYVHVDSSYARPSLRHGAALSILPDGWHLPAYNEATAIRCNLTLSLLWPPRRVRSHNETTCTPICAITAKRRCIISNDWKTRDRRPCLWPHFRPQTKAAEAWTIDSLRRNNLETLFLRQHATMGPSGIRRACDHFQTSARSPNRV